MAEERVTGIEALYGIRGAGAPVAMRYPVVEVRSRFGTLGEANRSRGTLQATKEGETHVMKLIEAVHQARLLALLGKSKKRLMRFPGSTGNPAAVTLSSHGCLDRSAFLPRE